MPIERSSKCHKKNLEVPAMWIRLLTVVAIVCLSGCANFKAVSEFAGQTTKMTSVVKDEFTLMGNHCSQQASVVAAVNNIRDDGPFKDCERYGRAQGELASLTVSVLDGYAKALTGLADDKSFDLSPDIKNISGKLQGLKDSGGNALVDAKELGAITKVVDLLVDLWTSAKREEAVRRMVAEAPNLEIIGNVLKSFFVETPGAPLGRAKAPYTNLVAIASSSVASTEVALNGPALRTAEPIRTFELWKDMQARKVFLVNRGAKFDANLAASGPRLDPTPPTPLVQAQIVSAIDAWLAALDAFSTDALKPDPKVLLDRLKVLRDKAAAARAAIEST
jgi:hypothetical protein